ncbi:unnamed protein product [Ixodes pacificus]
MWRQTSTRGPHRAEKLARRTITDRLIRCSLQVIKLLVIYYFLE